MAKGYAEGPAAEEAERRREELERGVDELLPALGGGKSDGHRGVTQQ